MLLGCKVVLRSSNIPQQYFTRYYDSLSPSAKSMLEAGHISQLSSGKAAYSANTDSLVCHGQTPEILPKSGGNAIMWGQQAPKSLASKAIPCKFTPTSLSCIPLQHAARESQRHTCQDSLNLSHFHHFSHSARVCRPNTQACPAPSHRITQPPATSQLNNQKVATRLN